MNTAPMFFDLSRLHEAHARFDRQYEASRIDQGEEGYQVVAPVDLGFDIHKDGRTFRLEGRVRTRLRLTCSRCVEPFDFAVDEPFEVLYVPHSENRGEGEVEVADGDLATAFYEDERIELGQLIREQFYLAIPMKALCAETCRGLCPESGTNLNLGSCGCRRTWEDPRLAPLGALMNDPQGH